MGVINAINNKILDLASLGTLNPEVTTQVIVQPSINSGNITTALLINPVFSPSSGTLSGAQISAQFNPQAETIYSSVYGLSVASTITPAGSGTVINAYGLKITGPTTSINGTLVDAYSLYVSNPAGAGNFLNNYTAILGTATNATVGIGTIFPAYSLDISGILSAQRTYSFGPLTLNNQLSLLTQGFNQGGLGASNVGTTKQMSQTTSAFFDLSSLVGGGFYGGVFDGHYIYLVPFGNNGVYSGTITRYNTTLPFESLASYSTFDITTINTNSKGFSGGLFDGRYVYFVPNNNGALFGKITRYDTKQPFLLASSYTVFDTANVISHSVGFQGGVYDGRYIYLVPSVYGLVARYDTTLSFTTSNSYTVFDLATVSANNVAFSGGVYDGRYIYLVPNSSGTSGTITRYDTSLSFNSSSSYTIFDTTIVSSNSKGFCGGVFDGIYIYLMPNGENGQITRFDTSQSFTLAGNYNCFNTEIINSNSKGFLGGVFDGRYIYLVPNKHNSGTPFGQITRYDTTKSFILSSSYTVFDTTVANINSEGFAGGIFDGRFVYFLPQSNTVLARVDAYTAPLATAIAANQAPNGFIIGKEIDIDTQVPPNTLIIYGTVGINTTNPQYTVDVNGDVIADAIIGPVAPGQNVYATGGTTRNQLITLAEGYSQGSLGGGSVGLNKQLSTNLTDVFDLTNFGGGGYLGGVFDGHYLYLVPNNNGTDSGTVTRYDTTRRFDDADSYVAFDTTDIDSNSKGFSGGVFDGRYVYFVPNLNGVSGQITRYDTTSSFTSAASYLVYNSTADFPTSHGFQGGVFDGRFIYFIPYKSDASTYSGYMTRYDTRGSFTVKSNYLNYNVATASSNAKGFSGGVFDGRYVYLVPNQNNTAASYHGLIARYDSASIFNADASYAFFDASSVNTYSVGFFGGIYDGRYIYFVPSVYGKVTRYDTTLSFVNANSYTVFDLTNINTTTKGFSGGAYDGRYLYLAPNFSGAYFGKVVRFDTTLSFASNFSYTVFDASEVNTYCAGFVGGVFDGRCIYLVPNAYSFLTRIDGYLGSQATAIAANQAPNGFSVGICAGTVTSDNLVVSNNIGVGTSTPQFPVDVVGVAYASEVFAQGLNTTQTYAIWRATDKQDFELAEGYNSGGFGSSYVSTNKLMSWRSITVYNLTSVGATTNLGAIFDGRYVYLVPSSTSSGQFIRYDTTLPFRSASSYVLKTLSVGGNGYNYGIFDGRYIYYNPASIGYGTIIRYDTLRSFSTTNSFVLFDTTSINGSSTGFQSGVFDGRYYYLLPGFHGQITRYDTTQSFTASSSYAFYNTTAVNPNSQEFDAGAFDGRYVYAIPVISGYITRYDTTKSFTAASSYAVFNTQTVNAGSYGYSAAPYDGRYIYLVPLDHGAGIPHGFLTRYDTNLSFTSIDSYTVFNLTQLNSASTGYNGGSFDGRYVFFVPYYDSLGNPGAGHVVTRYDTTRPFNSPASYTTFDVVATGFGGCASDGRYIYLSPNNTLYIVRIDSYLGSLATNIAAYQAPNGFKIGSYAGSENVGDTGYNDSLVVSGDVGIGTSSPNYTLTVQGTIRFTNLITTTTVLSGGIPKGLLTNNALLTVSEGYDQGGYSAGSPGQQKALCQNRAMSIDLTSVADGNGNGFMGSAFDGRYLYLVPNNNGSYFGQLVRYDTTLSMSAASSYTIFDATMVSGYSLGFAGSIFDGRYVYFVPNNNGSSGQITRYDTMLPFNSTSSYFVFDTTIVNTNSRGFQGGVFDGQYLYLVPNNNGTSGQITRYDTQLLFDSPDSYLVFDTAQLNSESIGFVGGTFDGRYIYLVPGISGLVTRYDTSLSFNSADSYTTFDTTIISPNSQGFYGGVFDGRYIYLIPNNNGSYFGQITRYDTTSLFNSSDSYAVFDTSTVHPNSVGFAGGVFDGRYIYFVPNNNGTSGQVTRYDTTLSFNLTGSYTVFDTTTINANNRGFIGGMFDGKYVYLIPNSYSILTRLEAEPVSQVNAIVANQAPNGFAVGEYANISIPTNVFYSDVLIVSGSVGIGMFPSFILDVNGQGYKPTSGTWTYSSDIRIKRNVQTISNAIDTICQLRPRKFHFISSYSKDINQDPNKNYYGFIADEVEGVLQGCVEKTNHHCYDGKMNEWMANNMQGSMPEPVEGLMHLKSLNIHNILIYNIQAIRELAEIQDRLQKELDNLKANN